MLFGRERGVVDQDAAVGIVHQARAGGDGQLRGRGVGLACSSYLTGAGLPINWNDLPHTGVQLKLDRSGGVTAFSGAAEIGPGSSPGHT